MKPQLHPAPEMFAEPSFVSGRGPAMLALNALAAEVARTDISVLLVGECGTGKDTYARLIHSLASPQPGILKKISCATLDSTHLLHQVQECLATGIASQVGVLFLDAVEELDLPSQRALASLLPDGESEMGRSANLRLLCSASTHLERLIEAGRFRRELYFRINGASLHLPPLRERSEDIPALVGHFLAKYAVPGRITPVLDHETMELLLAHNWPGNIRELENLVKKIVAFADPKAALSELRAAPRTVRRSDPLPDARPVSSLKVAARAASRRTERELILRALERTHWNRKRAAQELQISYKSLLYKIKQIQIPGSGSDEF